MTFLIGDIHGQYATFVRLLREAGLVSADLHWVGGRSTLWLLGDYVDRGPQGIDVIELVMRLQDEAHAAGGTVGALLGNHDLLLLAAYHFGDQAAGGPGGTFHADWLLNGGVMRDLEQLQPVHVAWLEALPAMARIGSTLLAHADATLYEEYGATVDLVNAAFHALLLHHETAAWDQLLGAFSARMAFMSENGATALGQFLRRFSATRVIHGHTPISSMTGQEPRTVSAARVYADGRCVNVDGGLYAGGPGFVFQI